MQNLLPTMLAAPLIQQHDLREVIQRRVVPGVEANQPSPHRLPGSDRRSMLYPDRLENLTQQHIPDISVRPALATKKPLQRGAQQIKILISIAYYRTWLPGIRRNVRVDFL